MIKRQEQINDIINNCRRKAFNRKKKCLVANCNKKAINSHIVWKNGIIRPIAPNSHLYELDVKNSHRRNNKTLTFTRTGINKILAFPGFCNNHDTKVFKEVENYKADYSKINCQVLVSLRGIYSERRKKEENIDWYKCILNQKILPDLKQILSLQENIQLHKYGVKDLNFYAKELNKEYYDPRGRFNFITRIIPKIPLVASSVFHTDSFDKMKYDYVNHPNWVDDPLNSVIITLFPFKENSFLIIGYHNNYFTENIELDHFIRDSTNNEILKFISDILIERIESWACSEEFYISQIKDIEEQIIFGFSKNPSTFSTSPRGFVNIFENYQYFEKN